MSTRIASYARKGALAGSAGLLVLFGNPATAFAAPVPGNNGTIKVHELTTPVDTNANDPDPLGCFYIDAFGFDANQALTWSVFMGTAGNTGAQVAAGSATFTATGTHGQDISGPIKLPDGMYVVFEDDSSGRKSKEIKVANANCSNGVPMVNGKVLGATGAIAAPAVLGYFLWRRRTSRTA